MQAITITKKAQIHIKNLLSDHLGEYKYIRLAVKSKGCAGATYKIEFAEAPQIDDEEFDFSTFKVLIDNKSLVYLIGLELDYKETDLEEGFIFNNPNKKGDCGCGESFFI
ncbi:MAG: iron-sulfur cluster assembly accessory protein [Proteobacteria bacterium]|nr:iron-sulfur cluster assembly accessory protein [Pseudomonadota bacterium]